MANGSYTVTPSKSGSRYTPPSQTVTVNGADVTGVNFTEATECISAGANADFYVTIIGNDNWSGTLDCPNAAGTDGPFASISRAQQAVRGILSNPAGRTNPIVVMLREGTYFQSRPLSFTSADSGTSTLQVIWQNYAGESPVVSGGMAVPSSWSNVSGNQWQIQLPASTQNFEQLFYNGERRLRPRLGTSAGNNLGAYYRVAAPVYLQAPAPPASAPDPNCSVYISGSGWECFDRFQYTSSDPISPSWQNLAPPAGNPCGQPAGNPNLVGDIELVNFEFFVVPR